MSKPLTYTERENKLLKLLRQHNKPVTTIELSRKFYGRNLPLNPRQSILHALRYLDQKLARNKAKERIVSSERGGPYPIEFWIEKPRNTKQV